LASPSSSAITALSLLQRSEFWSTSFLDDSMGKG
jgi:hypothetical protein